MTNRSRDSEEDVSVEGMGCSGFQEYLQVRRLENTCPLLKKHVKPDSRILDLGCGPGTITLDIAELASSGSVVGLDPNEEALEEAREVASERGIKNVEFQIGDAYSLAFVDSSFDLVYSHALLEWTRDAVAVMKEKKRVAKKGGWVIAVVASLIDLVLYPSCPTVMKYQQSLRHLCEPDSPSYFNAMCSHQVAGFVVDAGFTEYQIETYVPPIEIGYQGSTYFDYRYRAMCSVWTKVWSYDEWLVERRLMEPDFRKHIAEELEVWYAHPHAFTFHPRVAVIGRVS